jgi:hypothetical protein
MELAQVGKKRLAITESFVIANPGCSSRGVAISVNGEVYNND